MHILALPFNWSEYVSDEFILVRVLAAIPE